MYLFHVCRVWADLTPRIQLCQEMQDCRRRMMVARVLDWITRATVMAEPLMRQMYEVRCLAALDIVLPVASFDTIALKLILLIQK